jgi:ABC-type Fe3+-hydroxamate transport system substrate-binding protein
MNDIPEKSLAKIFDYENQGEELINNFCEKIEKRLG